MEIEGAVPENTTPYDLFAKTSSMVAFSPLGRTGQQEEISVNPRYLDFWFQAGTVPAPAIFAKMFTEGFHLLEFYHQAPDRQKWMECVQKQVAFQSREGCALPMLWVIAGGKPETLIKQVELRKLKGFPKEFYRGAPAYSSRLVVTSELPEIRDTLLLRLWGAGRTLKRAQEELEQLPKDSWEQRVIRGTMIALKRKNVYDKSEEVARMIQDYQKLVREWEEEHEAIGEARGEARGLQEAILAVYSSRFGPMPEKLQAHIESIQAPAKLQALVGLFAIQKQEDLMALME